MDTPRSIGVMQISVPGSGSAAKKDSDLTLKRFLRHPVEEAFNEFVSVETAKGESFDTNSVNLQFKNGIVASIFTSYATPLVENIVIIGTNGFIIIKDNKMELFHPRDTFDKNGLFTNPKNKEEIDLSFQNIGKDSLEKSINHFLEHLENSKSFDITYFDTCVYTNKLILDLEEKKL